MHLSQKPSLYWYISRVQRTLTKNVLKGMLNRYQILLSKLLFIVFQGLRMLPRGRFVATSTLERIFAEYFETADSNQIYRFHTPTWLTSFRARTLFTKEPETIEWIRQFPPNSVFWDVGANIGTYSIFAGINGARVISIEPSFMNLEILQRNIVLNQLNDKVSMIPIGLGSINHLANFYLSKENLTWGGAHNSLGKNIGYDGKALKEPLNITGLCVTMDDLVSVFKIPAPDFLKIDVDGLELDILIGGSELLTKVQSILIEVDQDFVGQDSQISKLLQSLGFERTVPSISPESTQNQIWGRKN